MHNHIDVRVRFRSLFVVELASAGGDRFVEFNLDNATGGTYGG